MIGAITKPPSSAKKELPTPDLPLILTPAAPPVNCGGVEALGTVPFFVDVASLLDSSDLVDVVGLNGALLTLGNHEALPGIEVGGAMDPSVGVPA